MFISLDDYGGMRQRIGHSRGGRFNLCCSHSKGWRSMAGQERRKGRMRAFTIGCARLILILKRIPTTLNSGGGNPDVMKCCIELI